MFKHVRDYPKMPRFPLSHGENRGSIPLGRAKRINNLIVLCAKHVQDMDFITVWR